MLLKILTAVCFMLVATSNVLVYAHPLSGDEEKKHKLVVAVVDAPPFSMKNEEGQWIGFSVDLWERIAQDLKLDYQLKETDLEGLLKGIENRSFDAAATGIYVTSTRESCFDFSQTFFLSNVTIAVNSDQVPSIWFVLHSALSSWNFLGLILLILTLALLGGLLLWLLEQRGESEHYGHKNPKSFGKSLLWSVMVLTGGELPRTTGWEIVGPNTILARLFAVFWVIFGVMTISLFTASAASVLTSRQLRSMINSPSDLQHVRVGTVAGSTDHGILQRMHIKHVVYDGPLELVQALAQHKIDAAVYGEPILRYYANNMFNDKIVVLRFSLHKYFVAIPLVAGSGLRKPINKSLLKTIESKEWQTTLANYMGNP